MARQCAAGLSVSRAGSGKTSRGINTQPPVDIAARDEHLRAAQSSSEQLPPRGEQEGLLPTPPHPQHTGLRWFYYYRSCHQIVDFSWTYRSCHHIVALHKLFCEAGKLEPVCTQTRPKSRQIDQTFPYLKDFPNFCNMILIALLRPLILAKDSLSQSKISDELQKLGIAVARMRLGVPTATLATHGPHS